MLPLDKFSEQAKEGFAAHGITEDSIMLTLCLDMDTAGRFGETWLCLDTEKHLHILSAEGTIRLPDRRHKTERKPGDSITEVKAQALIDAPLVTYDLSELGVPAIDNLVTSARLLVTIDGVTTILAQCSEARRQKLFTFVDLMTRIEKGETVSDDDPVFEAYNARCPKCGKIYANQQRRICEDCANKKGILARVLSYLKGHELAAAFCLLTTLVSAACPLIVPQISGILLFDNIINPEGKYHGYGISAVYIAILIWFAVSTLPTIMSILRARVNTRMTFAIRQEMKIQTFAAIQRMSMSFFNKNSTGGLMTRVSYDSDIIQSFLRDQVPSMLEQVINVLGVSVICFIMSWKLTLMVFIPVPIIIIILRFVAVPKMRRMYTKVWRRNHSMNRTLSDTLSGFRVVKAFAKEAEETNRFYNVAHNLREVSLELNLTSLTIFPVIGLLIGISANAIWGAGGIMVMQQHLTYGQFVAIWSYIGMLFGPIQALANFIDVYTNMTNSAQRMFEVIDSVPELTDAPDAVTMDDIKGDVRFEKVFFHYVPNRPILKDVTTHIRPGENIGIVGHTGSGKSTFVNLINRLYDVTSGQICVDGVNVKNIKLNSLQRNIAVVSQDTHLFRGTIAENIRYARSDATMDEVIRAAKIAHAHEFIIDLPEAYDTLVGTGARQLSGGQKQRISIARAILLDPRILILDEATAALDTETERMIQDALVELTKGRTTISIAHRLTTLKDCDRLIVIEDGKIAEEGTHDELMEKHGIYHHLYSIQAESMKKVMAGK